MAAVRSPLLQAVPTAAWPALAAFLVLAWALYEGLSNPANRSEVLLLLGLSIALFACTAVLNRRIAPRAPSRASAPVVAAVVASAPAQAPVTTPAPVPTPAPAPIPAAAPALTPAPARSPAPAPVASAAPALVPSREPAQMLMEMTLGDLLLQALADDPEDAGRLLTRLLSRTGKSAAQPRRD